jgi:hypothetical protein
MRSVFPALLLVASAAAKDCQLGCDLFERSQQRYLTHEAKVGCKKHNISPRPTTEDICLSTFRAITHSICMNLCDPEHNIVEDVSARSREFVFYKKKSCLFIRCVGIAC